MCCVYFGLYSMLFSIYLLYGKWLWYEYEVEWSGVHHASTYTDYHLFKLYCMRTFL